MGTPLAVVVDDKKDIKAAYDAASVLLQGAAAPAAAAAPSPPVLATTVAPAAPAPSGGGAPSSPSVLMPAARALLLNNNVSATTSIAGTGKGGRVTKGDVLAHLGHIPAAALAPFTLTAPPAPLPAATPAPPAPAASVSSRARGHFDTKPSNMRRVIASRLGESKATVPHQYASIECCLDAVLALRASLKAGGVAVSVNDVVIAAAGKALRAVPAVNAFYDAKADEVKSHTSVDVSVAVATDGGLITPIVKSADALGLSGIARTVKDLAARARGNKLAPAEFQGGSFTISNLGMFGSISDFSAVINAPQAAILAVGKGEQRVVLAGTPASRAAVGTGVGEEEAVAAVVGAGASGEPRIATMMTVELSADARVVDAADAARFLQSFRSFIEDPQTMLA